MSTLRRVLWIATLVILGWLIVIALAQAQPSSGPYPKPFYTSVNPVAPGGVNTITAAIASAPSGSLILLSPGIYEEGTNVLNLPNNVSLVGQGPGVTTIRSSCGFNTDGAGNHFYNGPDIVPGDNSYIAGFTIVCTTNGRYCSAIGCEYLSNTKSFTNVTVQNVVATNFTTDVWYFDHTNNFTIDFYSCKAYSKWDAVAVSAGGGGSKVRFFNCDTLTDPSGINGGLNPTRIATLINQSTAIPVEFHSCSGLVTNALNAYGLWTQANDHSIIMDGGVFNVYTTNAGTLLYYAGPHVVDGRFTINGINVNVGGTTQTKVGLTNSDTTVVGALTANQFGEVQVTVVNTSQAFGLADGVVNIIADGLGSIILENTGASKLDGNVTLGATLIPSSGAFVRTNFVSGQLYTNSSGAPINVSANAVLTLAAAAGDATLSLRITGQGGVTNQFGQQTLVTSLVTTNIGFISGWVTNGGTYTFTNTSAGAGDSATVTGGQIIIY